MRRPSVWAWGLAVVVAVLAAFAGVPAVSAGSGAPAWWAVACGVTVVLSAAAVGVLVVARGEGSLLLASELTPATGLLSLASMLVSSRGTPAHARCDLGGACGP